MVRSFLITLIVGLAIPPLMRWLMQGAQREVATTDPTRAQDVMRPSVNHRRLALVLGSVLSFTGLAIMLGSRPYWQIGAIFGAPIAMWGLLAIYSLKRRVILSDEGIESVSPWTGRVIAKWSEVQGVRFREWGQTIRLRINGKERIVIPCSMAGLSGLEKYMKAHLGAVVVGDTFESYKSYAAAL